MIKWLIHQLTRPTNWAYGLFWSWNLIFLAFMLLGFAPTVLPDMIIALRTGAIPLIFPLFAGALILIPFTSVILALIFVCRSPGKLFALGYGVEGPLMILLAIRFFAVGQMTPAVALVMTVAGLGLLTFLWQLLDRRIDSYGSLLTHLRALGLTLLLLTGFYAAIWIAFYALPMTWAALTWLVESLASLPFYLFDFLRSLWDFLFMGPFLITGSLLFFYSATLFVLMPLALPVLCFRAWRQGLQTLAARYGRTWAIAFTLIISIVGLGLLIQANYQPQHQAFTLLAEPPANPAAAEALLAQEDTLRQGLLNAYLAPYRYFSAAGEVYHISDIYKEALGLSPQQAGQVQGWYELVVRPLLYVPVESYETGGNRWENQALRQEPLKAAELYESFFDRTIIEGERETIVRAVRSTWAVDQAQAAWQAVDDREVYLVRQELNITEQEDWAELELYEVYENQTTQRQEVVYYFSLPESAVITGVWLGTSPDRDSRFVYRVSPRGAAQTLYRSEVRRNMDPALIEQLGPRQYRLRVFPVEPQTWNWEGDSRSTLQAGPQLHMWLTWRVLAQEQGWLLPRLAERRNVYWDAGSVRLVKGEPLEASSDSWLPTTVPAAGPVEAVAHRVDFSNGETVLIQPSAAGELPQLPVGLHLAVVLDRSRTMVAQAAAVEAALARLGEVTGQGGSLELYLTASSYRGETPSRIAWTEFKPADILYYGGQNAAELLVQFDQLHEDETYDALIVLTDGTGYELGEGELQVPTPAAPVWMVHLDGQFPLGYDDATLEAIQASGGGVAGSLEEALTRLAVALSAQQTPSTTLDVADGYTWLTMPTAEVEANFGDSFKPEPLDSDFTALAARRLILAEMERQRAGLSQLATLDQLHAIAIEHSLVSPYSSMIVLVNEAQERRLDQLEAQADRFAREVEAVGETTPEFNVTGVPEPEEWLLLALAAGMLAWYGYGRLRPRITA